MAKTSIDNLVINYDDYSTITQKFKENNNYPYDDKYDVVFNYAQGEENWMKQKFETTYDQIFRHLKNSRVMMSYMQQGCKYISYFLHKHVKDELHDYYDPNYFEILHKYVKYFYKYDGRTDKNCLPHIVYVNYDMYQELNTIYGLYNQYNKLLPMNSQWEDSKCLSLQFFIKQYNDYIKNINPTRLELKKILKPFERHVRNAINGLNGKCTKYTYPLENIDQPKPPEENKQQRIQESAPLQQESLQHQVENQGGRRSAEATQLTLTKSLPSSSELRSITTESGKEHVVETDLRSGRDVDSVREQFRESETEEQELQDYRTHALNETMGRSEYRQTVKFPEKLELTSDQSLYPQNGVKIDQGFMANMRNAITGVLGEVDPVPVVGVSGGMGALFLLFRYTPVGTFFRGGRGRAHRIPRSFNGQFLGGFQGYEDYDVGHIGYGPMNPLAE